MTCESVAVGQQFFLGGIISQVIACYQIFGFVQDISLAVSVGFVPVGLHLSVGHLGTENISSVMDSIDNGYAVGCNAVVNSCAKVCDLICESVAVVQQFLLGGIDSF